jgi:transmembrane sensor
MRQVSRWYDVDIAYEGTLAKQNFGGSVSKFKDISFLLKTLELTGTIHFKIDGRRITVMP